MLSANFKPKTTAATSRGFRATARLSCSYFYGDKLLHDNFYLWSLTVTLTSNTSFTLGMLKYLLLWPPDSYAGRRPFCFTAVGWNLSFFFFSPANLRGRLADRHQTLPHVRWWPRFIKFGQKFWCPPKFGGPKSKTSKCRRDLIALYLRNATRHRQSENGVANYGQFRKANLIRCTLDHKRLKML